MTTTNDLIDKHNELARAAGTLELTDWKKSKAELEARIAAMIDPLDMTADPEPAAGFSAPEPKVSVASVVAEVVMDAGLNYAEVAAEVRRRKASRLRPNQRP